MTAHEVSNVGSGLVHPSPMDLGASQSPEVSAQCGPRSCPSHPSFLPLWQVRMGLLESCNLMDGLGRVYALLYRAGGFLLFLSSKLHFWAPFHSDFIATFFFTRCDVGSLLPRAGLGGSPRVIPSWAAHWPIAPIFPPGFQLLLISLRKLFQRVPVCCASASSVLWLLRSLSRRGFAVCHGAEHTQMSSVKTSGSACMNNIPPL